jgi:hypothetical protein
VFPGVTHSWIETTNELVLQVANTGTRRRRTVSVSKAINNRGKSGKIYKKSINMSWIRSISDRNERLKQYVHNGMRYPLPKYGQYIMGLVYFTIPVIGGWYIMQWAISKSHESIGYNGERLPIKTIQGIGNQRPVTRTTTVNDTTISNTNDPQVVVSSVQYEKLGAGGWGGGVHLVVSDEEEQKRNRKKLRKLLKKLHQSNNDEKAEEVVASKEQQPQ